MRTKHKMMRGCGESLKVMSSDRCPDLEKHDYEVGVESKPSHKQSELQTEGRGHTPTPWNVQHRADGNYGVGQGQLTATVCNTFEEAVFIVKCVNENQQINNALKSALEDSARLTLDNVHLRNAHEELVKTIKHCLVLLEQNLEYNRGSCSDLLRKALSQAEEI